VGGSYYFYPQPNHQQTVVADPTLAYQPTPAPAPAPKLDATPTPAPAPATADKVVHKGEGIEHPLIRQLVANSDLLANPGAYAKLGVKAFTGDRTDKAALKKWAGVQADILARGIGHTDNKFGAHEEIRILHPDTRAYAIEKDATGTLSVVEYSASKVSPSPTTSETTAAPSFTLAQVSSHSVATTSAAAHFVGPLDGTTVLPAPLSSYEYMYVG
jgi:hypothetical protein